MIHLPSRETRNKNEDDSIFWAFVLVLMLIVAEPFTPRRRSVFWKVATVAVAVIVAVAVWRIL